MSEYEDGLRDGETIGLVKAMLRLSEAGLHNADCPEPDKPCTCGIDAAIQRPPVGLSPVPLANWVTSPWGRHHASRLVDVEPDNGERACLHGVDTTNECPECGYGFIPAVPVDPR